MEQTQDNWTGTGYDAEPGGGGGLYLRLKDKGQAVRLRLVSDPYRYVDEIKLSDTERKTVNKAAWVAIHKEVVDRKPVKRVVVFQAGPMVYGLIKDLAENEAWGDPRLYDIEITRTEQAGKYYTVQALPKPIGPISEEEAELVAAANIDIVKACVGKHETKADSPAPATAGYDPFSDE